MSDTTTTFPAKRSFHRRWTRSLPVRLAMIGKALLIAAVNFGSAPVDTF